MGSAVGYPGLSSDLWSTALNALERKYSKPIFEMWLKPIRPIAMNETELVLAVQSSFARDWVENRLKTDISEALAELLGQDLASSSPRTFGTKRRRTSTVALRLPGRSSKT